MNKRQIIASLNNIANTLDNSGLFKEATSITKVMIKLAEEESNNNEPEPERKSHLQRMIEQYERRVKRIFEEIHDSTKRSKEFKNEFTYTMDDLDPKDRPAFEVAAQEILNKIRDSR
jgi:ABC-type xylose transport system substrate-binding protein